MSTRAVPRPSFFNRFYRALILPGLVLFVITGYISLTSPLQPDNNGVVGYPLWVRLACAFAVGPTSIILGWFVARRFKDSLIGPILIHWGCATNAELGVGYLPAFWGALSIYFLSVVVLPGMALMLASFPNGRGVSQRWDHVMKGLVLLAMVYSFIRQMSSPTAYGLTSASPLALPALVPYADQLYDGSFGFLAVILLAVGLLIYRYRIGGAVDRKQMRWLVVLGLFFLLFIAYGSTVDFEAGLSAVESGIFSTMALLAFALPSVGISLAILFHHLWDIDILIRRTLIYAVSTAVLGAVYFGSVVVMQALLRGVTNTDSPLVIVLSTLLIAALFAPVRARVQRGIDRRFYRQKYDAVQTLARFAASARDETDLEQLSERLQGAVQETMQPASVGLWLRPALGRDRQN
jgi:hypothetical protein